jgi:hypothetical protein
MYVFSDLVLFCEDTPKVHKAILCLAPETITSFKPITIGGLHFLFAHLIEILVMNSLLTKLCF